MNEIQRTRARREEERLARQESILAAARGQFRKHGYAGTTMPGVAHAARVAPGTLYLYFPSKDALYAELLVEGYRELIAVLRSVRPRGNDPRRQAEGLIEAFLAFARRDPQHFDVMFFVKGVELAPEQRARIDALERECKECALPIVERAPRRPRDARATLDTVWSMLVGLVGSFGREPGFDKLAGIARRIVLDALFPET